MKRVALACVLAGCTDDTTPPWQLDHDRILAVRAQPPSLAPGEVGSLEALVAHAAAPTSIDQPRGATAAFAPGELFTAVHYNVDHWQIDGPQDAQLDIARAELGLPAGSPVPLEISLIFPGPLYATKIVLLGEAAENPPPPVIAIDGAPAATEVALEVPVDALIEVDYALIVRWFTSCGTLHDHDTKAARLIVDEVCDGELVVVVRDERGGVAWQVLPLHAR